MNKIGVCLCGCFGKMGSEIIDMQTHLEDIDIVAGIDPRGRTTRLFPVFCNVAAVTVQCDILLDFSSPAALPDILEFANTHKKVGLVICTTGYTQEEVKQIEEASKSVPIFFSGNTSLGVNVLIKLAMQAKKLLGKEFDIEIIEKHHNKKTDAPSGTSLMIAGNLSEGKMKFVYDRSTTKVRRTKSEIGIHSVRCGGIKGEHEIIFASEDEILSLKHIAGSRSIFAKGALEAVRYIYGKRPGLYTMDDMLKSIGEKE